MAFDDELTRAFDTLTERLRGEVDLEVQRRTADAIAAIPPPDPIVVEVPVAVHHAPSDDHDSGAARERLAAAMRAIDAARTLTAVLDALLDAARAESPGADVWLLRGGTLHRWRASGHDAAADAPPQIEDGIPLTIGGATVALLTERRTTNDEPRTTSGEPRTSNVLLLARYAARCLESLTAFKTARALTQPSSAARGSHPSTGAGRPEPLEAAMPGAEAESEDETSARRYARLLVSEIKLYHEPAVIDGCRDRDLATRLGGEIARARAMYEQRVPTHVRERADYFRTELVRTLCNGDASLLEVRS